MGVNLYDDLGVSKTADRAAIKRAYRKKAQKLHPDRDGGDADKFHAVQKAYDVLYDDARRAHYDATGQDGQEDRHGALMQRLAALFMAIVESQDVDHADIVGLMRSGLRQGKSQTQGAIKTHEQKIAKFERAKKRLKRKGDGENIFAQMLDAQITANRRAIEMGEEEMSKQDDMLKLLEDYSYAVEKGGAQQEITLAGTIFSFR